MKMIDYLEASLTATYERRLRELKAERRKATTAVDVRRIDKSIRHFEERLGR